MGAICDENLKVQHFDNKREMWARIHELGNRCKRQKRTLLIYAHNMQYDYYAIRGQERPKDHIQFAYQPFIVDVRDKNDRVYMKFLSTTSLFRGSLANMGEMMGVPKGKTPQWLIDGNVNHTWEERLEAKRYLEQDARIVMIYVQQLRDRLKAANMRPRWLISSSQVGINALLKEMQKSPNHKALFYDTFKRLLWRTRYPEEIHKACRGGRVQALQFGEFENVTSVDINSHYPDCLRKIRFPDLSTQMCAVRPLDRGWNVKDVLSRIGVSECVVRIKRDLDFGLLPIRLSKKENAYPTKKSQVLIGSWTNDELLKATSEGYEILEINKSHFWRQTENPFTEFVPEKYKIKSESEDECEVSFMKTLLNGGIGKFLQRREKCDYRWESVEKHHKMLANGWEAMDTEGTDRLYKKVSGIDYPKYYAPIIYALVTAKARMTLYDKLKGMNPSKVYYMDTDSIVGDDKAIKNARFKYGKSLGEFKVEEHCQNCQIYGKKAYSIGDHIKLSGVGKIWINSDDFKNGVIHYRRMLTDLTTQDKSKVGTFKRLETNLKKTMADAIKSEKKVHDMKLIVDHKNDVSSFIDQVNKWTRQKESMLSES